MCLNADLDFTKEDKLNFEERLEKRPRRTVLGILLSGVAIIAVVSAASWGIRMVMYPVQQAGRIMEKTLDADNVIGNYEWFKQQVQDVKAMDTRLAAARQSLDSYRASAGDRSKWGFEEKQEEARLNAIVLGLQGQRAGMVAEYNAKSQMENRALFKTRDLPDTLE